MYIKISKQMSLSLYHLHKLSFTADAKDPENRFYDELFNMWIQENNKMPSGYLLDTSEEALLLPDWLKLRMLRSLDERLVSAGKIVSIRSIDKTKHV